MEQEVAITIRRTLRLPPLLLLLLAAACGEPVVSKKLTLSFNPWPGFYPVVIAQAKGFFADHGVAVELVRIAETESHLAEIAAGRFDGALLTIGSAVVAAGGNADFWVIMAVDQSAGADAVVARLDARPPADLRGRRIGTMRGGFGELFVLAMLEQAGLTTDEVSLVNTTGVAVPGELAAGRIAAGHTWEPYVSRAVDDGAEVLFTSLESPGLIQDVLIFQQRTLRDRPDAVRGFVDAWFEAVNFWLANPEEGAMIIARALNITAEECSWEGIELFNRADNLAAFGPDGSSGTLHDVARRYADFYVRAGNMSTKVDVAALLEPAFLRQGDGETEKPGL